MLPAGIGRASWRAPDPRPCWLRRVRKTDERRGIRDERSLAARRLAYHRLSTPGAGLVIGELDYFGDRGSGYSFLGFAIWRAVVPTPGRFVDDAAENAGHRKNWEESAGGSEVTILA